MTNQEIFEQVISENPMNAGILREALAHYVQLINKAEPWKDSLIDFNSWVEWTNELKKRIDDLYNDNSNLHE
jgi:hypothetical protein